MLKKILTTFLCIIWMGFIFYNSSNSGEISNKKSYYLLNNIRTEFNNLKQKNNVKEENKIKEDKKTTVQNTKPINETLNKSLSYKVGTSSSKEQKLNLILRKNAHAFEYLVLAIFVSAFLFSFNVKGRRALIYIMFVCLFYAVTDEFHQSFVPGRTSLVSDVLIDFLGGFIGIFVFYLVYYKLYNSKLEKVKVVHL